MKLLNVREEYLKRSIENCNRVIEEFNKELFKENDEYVKEIITEIIEVWEMSKKEYLILNSLKGDSYE